MLFSSSRILKWSHVILIPVSSVLPFRISLWSHPGTRFGIFCVSMLSEHTKVAPSHSDASSVFKNVRSPKMVVDNFNARKMRFSHQNKQSLSIGWSSLRLLGSHGSNQPLSDSWPWIRAAESVNSEFFLASCYFVIEQCCRSRHYHHHLIKVAAAVSAAQRQGIVDSKHLTKFYAPSGGGLFLCSGIRLILSHRS